MKHVPFVLALLFITLTIGRVAEFFGNDIRAYLMAVALALSVYTFSYFSNFKTTRKSSIIALVVFALIEGYFNTIETVKWSIDIGRWSFTVEGWNVYRTADIVYGIFPTIAAALLAWVGKNVERIPSSDRKVDLFAGIAEWASEKLPWHNRKDAGREIKVPAIPENTPELLPEWLPIVPESKEHFRQLYREGVIRLPDNITGAELAEHLPVGERSARNWLTYAKNGHSK